MEPELESVTLNGMATVEPELAPVTCNGRAVVEPEFASVAMNGMAVVEPDIASVTLSGRAVVEPGETGPMIGLIKQEGRCRIGNDTCQIKRKGRLELELAPVKLNGRAVGNQNYHRLH